MTIGQKKKEWTGRDLPCGLVHAKHEGVPRSYLPVEGLPKGNPAPARTQRPPSTTADHYSATVSSIFQHLDASSMTATTTVQIPVTMKARLNEMKIHPRETYADVLERILEDLEELGPETRRAVEKSRREMKAGKFKTLDEVKRELGL